MSAHPRQTDAESFTSPGADALAEAGRDVFQSGQVASLGSDPQHRPSPVTSLAGDGLFSDPSNRSNSSYSSSDLADAQTKANLCEQFLELTASGSHSLRSAASALGKSPSTFSGPDSILARYQRGGVAALLPNHGRCGSHPGELSAQIEALEWFIPAARFFYLLTNRTVDTGSAPEAIRRTLSLPKVPTGWNKSVLRRFLKSIGYDCIPACPQELREQCLAREKTGQALAPDRVMRAIRARREVVRQYRNPRETALDYLNAGPGTLRLAGDRLARAGEIIEADDATINFPVCVPWSRDGSDDPCVQKFGVKVARFQWLVSIDVGTSFITGFSYTARPRASYRAEDIVSLMRTVVRQHGIPRQWRFERGAWESNLVKNAIKLMGSSLHTVYSPHAKPFIEGLFNVLWTKLSVHFPGSHVGRFMGDEREASLLLEACKRGAKDPRRYFPMLSQALAAFQEVIAEKNRTPVNTASHGRWVPEERWLRETDPSDPSDRSDSENSALRPLDPASDWLFCNAIRDWTVKGMLVGGRINLFEGMRVPFDFSAPWLVQYHGAKVRCHFDFTDPRCIATVVLRERWNNHKAGEVLGQAQLVSSTASYARLMLGWGDDPTTAGLKAKQQTASALRREVRAILPKGQTGAGESEVRDGLGAVTKLEKDGDSAVDTSVPRVAVVPADPEATRREIAEREARIFGNPLDFV